jgi:hypothetical protein
MSLGKSFDIVAIGVKKCRVFIISELSEMPMKTTYLAKDQVKYFNLLAGNSTSISLDNMDPQSVNNENPDGFCKF